jgi:hypothetical protein
MDDSARQLLPLWTVVIFTVATALGVLAYAIFTFFATVAEAML